MGIEISTSRWVGDDAGLGRNARTWGNRDNEGRHKGGELKREMETQVEIETIGPFSALKVNPTHLILLGTYPII